MADQKNLGFLAHILGLFTGWVGPLIIYLIADKGQGKDNAREALNWNISLIIYYAISWVLAFIIVGFVLMAVLGICHIIFSILGIVAANKGEVYSYPMTIKFLKGQ
ncbi:MAG: putative Tic20 family protein [Candidatus Woesearchaeota archaeon]|jgi:uncharacterized Tic20 family protein